MPPNNPNQPRDPGNYKPPGSHNRPSTDGFNNPQNRPPNTTPPGGYPVSQYPLPGQHNQPNAQGGAQPNLDNQPQYQPHRPTQPVVQSQGGFQPPTHQPPTGQNDFAAAKKRKKRDEIKNTLFTIILFILAPLFAVFMIVFVFQSYVVDGSSMEPTLQNGDRVFILKLPKSLASMQNEQWIPARGEVVVFKKPNNEGTQLIKRVIGLPGDKVVIENGELTVFNIDNPAGFNPDAGRDYDGTLAEYDSEQNIESNVGQGELFVLGDNRSPGGSLDSHSGLGLVPIENVVGRLWIRYFPLSSFDVYANIFKKFELAV